MTCLLLLTEMMQSTMNKVQVDHDVDVAYRSLQRGIVMTLLLGSQLKVEMYWMCENKLAISCLSKVVVWQTDIQTDGTLEIIYHATSLLISNYFTPLHLNITVQRDMTRQFTTRSLAIAKRPCDCTILQVAQLLQRKEKKHCRVGQFWVGGGWCSHESVYAHG